MLMIIVGLMFLVSGSVCAGDVSDNNSTLQTVDGISQDEIAVSHGDVDENLAKQPSDDTLNDGEKVWVNITLSPKYGVSGQKLYITPTAKYENENISGNVTFYSDFGHKEVMGNVSTRGGYIDLPILTGDENVHYYPVYYTFIGDDSRYVGDDFDYLWIMNENIISLNASLDGNNLNLAVKPAFYKNYGNQSHLHVIVNNREVGTFQSVNSTYSIDMNKYKGIDVYVTYDGYINVSSNEYYASGISNHFTMSLDMIFTNSTYGNVTAVILMPYAGNCTLFINSSRKYERMIVFDNPGNKTILIPDIAASSIPYNVTLNSQFANMTKQLTVSKATPSIYINNVGGNDTYVNEIHNFTILGSGSGKITTNCTSGNFNLNETIILNNTYLKAGKNRISIHYSGDENHTEAFKEIIFYLHHNNVNVSASIELNGSAVMEGNKVLIISNATYMVGDKKYQAKGMISIYSDEECKNLLSTIPVGGNYTYAVNKSEGVESSYDLKLYLKYGGFVDDVNNYTSQVTYGGNVVVIRQNSMNLTVNGNREHINFKSNQTLNLAVNLKYYQSELVDSNFKSNIIIYVDGEVYGEFNATGINAVDAGKIKIDDMGVHTVYAYYKGINGTKHIAPVKSNEILLFNLPDTSISLNANATTSKYGQYITVTPLVKDNNNVTLTNGTVTYYIGGTPVSGNLTPDKPFIFKIDRIGQFNITAKYYGYDYYGSSECNISINGQKADNPVELIVPDRTYGEDIVVAIFNAVDGVYTVKIGNNNILINVSNGYGLNESVKLNLSAGNGYFAEVFFDNEFYTTNANDTFDVIPAKNDLNISIPDIYYGGNLTVSISNAIPGDYVVDINGTNVTVKVGVNGTGFNKTFINFKIGTYTAIVRFGNNNYTTDASIKFNVCKFKSIVEIISCKNITYPSDLIVEINIENETSSVYQVIDENNKVVLTGQVQSNMIKISGLVPGKYILIVINAGDEYISPSSSSMVFEVSKLKTKLYASNVISTYNAKKFITVTLKDEKGKLLSKEKISIKINGKTKIVTTNTKGQAKLTTKGIVPKKYNALITFGGNKIYSKSTKTIKVKINKAKSYISAKKKTFKRNKKTKKYTILLKNNNKKAIKKVKVYLKIKGKTYKAKTNAKGKAVFKLKKLTKKGKFSVKIKFKGNKYYKAITKKTKIIIQ